MVRARKYSAKLALYLEPEQRPRIAILEEKFKGKDTWAHPDYRRPNAEIDKELRDRATKNLLTLAWIGENPIFNPGVDSYGQRIIPTDFSGIIIYEARVNSNNAEGLLGVSYKEIQRIEYIHDYDERIEKMSKSIKPMVIPGFPIEGQF